MDFDLALGKSILERTPATLSAMLEGLGPEWTNATEGPDTWSPYDVVGHLIHGERDDWIPRARIILSQGSDRQFTPFDRYAQFRDSKGKTLSDLLAEFAQVRAEGLAELDSWNLNEKHLSLEGVHPEFGEVTLRQLLATWVVHDLGHIAQIGRVMAKQYADAVGPWTVYLPVLHR